MAVIKIDLTRWKANEKYWFKFFFLAKFNLQETHKNVEGLSSRFVEMETIINALCRTVDTLQGQIKTDDKLKKQPGTIFN